MTTQHARVSSRRRRYALGVPDQRGDDLVGPALAGEYIHGVVVSKRDGLARVNSMGRTTIAGGARGVADDMADYGTSNAD